MAIQKKAKAAGDKNQNLAAKQKDFVYLTSQGLEDVRAELALLKTVKRIEVADRIQKAREFANSEENNEYDSAVEEQIMVENRILALENVLKHAVVISPEHTNDFIVIGSTVKIELDGQLDEFTIVGKVEANPFKKRISNESPVGAALLGAKVGEELEINTPILRYKCRVLEIK